MKYDLTQLMARKVNEIIIDSILTFTEDDELANNDSYQIEPVQVTGTIVRNGNEFSLDLHYESTWTYVCGRCLKDTPYVIEGDVKRSIVKDQIDGDDDIVFVESTVIDLYDVIYNDIVLNLPGQVLCDDECKGLCPDCGANLNDSSCTCADEKVDPRLLKLKNLFTHD